jgi:hypothetical protein
VKRKVRICIGMLVSLFILIVAAPVATAASPHFKHGGTPACRDTGTTIECKGSLAGLGNADVVFRLSANGLASFACVNPGGNESPGQNKVPFTASSVTTISAGDIKNGNLAFDVFAPQTPPTATATEAGCPNPNWSTRLTDVAFSNARLVIEQPAGTVIFTCTRSGAITATFQTLTCV